MEYTFVLNYQISGDESDADALVERLAVAGCEDALVGIGQPGRLALEFTREADSAETAIRSALADVARAIPSARLLEAEGRSTRAEGLDDVMHHLNTLKREPSAGRPGQHMPKSKEEIQAALGLDAPPDEDFMMLLARVGDADIIAGPPAPGGGISMPRAGRITEHWSFLDLVDELGHGTRAQWAQIYASALRDPAMRATVARAAKLVDPDFADAGACWLAALEEMPPCGAGTAR